MDSFHPSLLVIAAIAAIIVFVWYDGTRLCSCPQSQPQFLSNQFDVQTDRISVSSQDISWLKLQLQINNLSNPPKTPEDWHRLRKGINPRTREHQLEDLLAYRGISHYEDKESIEDRIALPCPPQLLVEEHHSNYGEPWAGGRDVFVYLANAAHLSPRSKVLEIGCGTLRVGIHFIRYLERANFHCIERDDLSLMAAFYYEIPYQGLLHKTPLIVKGEDMNLSKFGNTIFDLVYASAVFLHMPDGLVWSGLETLSKRMKPYMGRLFVSHNIKFCSRLGGQECTRRLMQIGLRYIGKHIHDSLLFNHYEIWYEFKREGDGVRSAQDVQLS